MTISSVEERSDELAPARFGRAGWSAQDGWSGQRERDGLPQRRGVSVGDGRRRRGVAECSGTHAPDLHGSRLAPRGRLVVGVIWLMMATAAWTFVSLAGGLDSSAPVTTKVMVEPGESLWQLAGDVVPAADRHETVAAIMELNGLDSASEIMPGDILVVPVQR